MSVSNMTIKPNPDEMERERYKEFAVSQADPEYREPLAWLYSLSDEFNREFFDGKLSLPHLGLGLTSPRRFSQCQLTTNYGGRLDITLSAGIAFGANTRVVRRAWPAEGNRRFLGDLLLAETVKQSVLEIRGTAEDGYGGYGPLFAEEATRIGKRLGLGPVIARRRGYRGADQPVAALWPWAFREEGYYLGDIRLSNRSIAGLRPRAPSRLAALPGAYEYFLYLLVTGRAERLRLILERQVDADRETRSPALAAAERSPLSSDGRSLPIPEFDPNWMEWNLGCVALMAKFIHERRAFDGMPILADALQDAGCENQLVLDHCRIAADHTSNCWVLRALKIVSSER